MNPYENVWHLKALRAQLSARDAEVAEMKAEIELWRKGARSPSCPVCYTKLVQVVSGTPLECPRCRDVHSAEQRAEVAQAELVRLREALRSIVEEYRYRQPGAEHGCAVTAAKALGIPLSEITTPSTPAATTEKQT